MNRPCFDFFVVVVFSPLRSALKHLYEFKKQKHFILSEMFYITTCPAVIQKNRPFKFGNIFITLDLKSFFKNDNLPAIAFTNV